MQSRARQNHVLTRASTIAPIADVIERAGGRVARVFADAELPLQLLDQPDRLLLLRDQFRLVERAAREIGDELLPARLSLTAGLDGLGPYGAHLCRFVSLGKAIAIGYNRLASLLQAATSMELVVEGKMARWSYAITAPLQIGRQKNEILALGYMLAILRYFVGAGATPDRIELPGRFGAVSRLAQLFASEVARGPRAAVIFPAPWLNCPNPNPRDTPYQAPQSLPADGDFAALTVHLVALEQLRERSGIDPVAARLGLTRRTLQRRLAAEGTTFERLCQQMLASQACTLLQDPGRPVTEIALALGYGDPAHFTRAFRRWTGVSPSQWRSQWRKAQGSTL